MNQALVLGANGQDGSYLCEVLAHHGTKVLGVGKQPVSKYLGESDHFAYRQLDLRRDNALGELLQEVQPASIYHLAAVHGSAGFRYEPVWGDALDVNIKALHTALEYARKSDDQVRIFYPSSAKVFGAPLPESIDITAPKKATCLYSTSKICAENLISYYRAHHKVFASIAYLFNHDSPRRPASYFLPRIALALRKALAGEQHVETLNTLNFYCDWGSAREFMEFAALSLAASGPQDFILATGETLFARTFVADLFSSFELDYKQFIAEKDPSQSSDKYMVDLQHTQDLFGKIPRVSADTVCKEIATS